MNRYCSDSSGRTHSGLGTWHVEQRASETDDSAPKNMQSKQKPKY